MAQYLAKNPRPAPDLTDYKSLRDGMILMDNAMVADLPQVPPETEFYHDIPMRDGFMSTLKIHKPASSKPPGPLIVVCFGGGFVGGSKDQLTRTSRALVKTFGATVVNISYRLAPENKFPAAQHDCWDSMKWIASNAKGSVLTSNPSKGFLMGGVSAGGALTASFSRIFQEQPLEYPLTGQWLSVPSLMYPEAVPEEYKDYFLSTDQQDDGPFLSRKAREALKGFAEWDVSSPLRYAINSNTPISGQPKTYFQVCGMDPLRDDALIYDEMLKNAGVETKVDLYEGCPHAHFAAFPTLEISKKADIDTVVGFGWLQGVDVGREEAREALGY